MNKNIIHTEPTQIKIVEMDIDNYHIIQLAMKELDLPEHRAVNVIMELGLLQFLQHGKRYDKKHLIQSKIEIKLNESAMTRLAKALQAVWNIEK